MSTERYLRWEHKLPKGRQTSLLWPVEIWTILAPDAKRVRGYPLRMPSYEGHLSHEELLALTGYVKSLPGPTSAPSDVPIAVDPVCHMKVRVTRGAQTVARDGGRPEYFCSAWCRARFAENPDAYRH